MREPERLQRKADYARIWWGRAALAFCLLTGCFAAGTWINQLHLDHASARIAALNGHLRLENRRLRTLNRSLAALDQELRVQVVEGCERLNVKQVEDNKSQLADYTYDSVVLHLLLTSPQAHTRAGRRRLRRFTGTLRAAIDAKAWVAPIPDCAQVSTGFRLPGAIPIHLERPPASALSVPSQ